MIELWTWGRGSFGLSCYYDVGTIARFVVGWDTWFGLIMQLTAKMVLGDSLGDMILRTKGVSKLGFFILGCLQYILS